MKITKELKEYLTENKCLLINEKRTSADGLTRMEPRTICRIMANRYNTGREITIDFHLNRQSTLWLLFDFRTRQFVGIDGSMGKQIKKEQATNLVSDLIYAIDTLRVMGFME